MEAYDSGQRLSADVRYPKIRGARLRELALQLVGGDDAVAAATLADVHHVVGGMQHASDAVGILRIERDADGGADRKLLVARGNGELQLLAHPFRDRERD